ncbi:MAG: PAS domain S-box protein [Abitibacteriaceae bacterium]|nr:PAS domain S-box protein [Abditibacteriaceae bacterium]MBV9868172.1 PAS domain S-box protein [Abditibacteriaceae bacterium]
MSPIQLNPTIMNPEINLDTHESTVQRAQELFHKHQQEIFKNTDHLFAGLMVFQWVAAIAAALLISPQTWAGQHSQTHIHVWAALFLGGAITVFPVWLALTQPGCVITRYTVAVAQMLMSALLIHISGGRIETHFHVFGSLVILSFYRDWRVLIPATIVVGVDHFVRGIYFPQSVYGVLTASPWRSVEHTAWVVFEDIFLLNSCVRSVREMRSIAQHTAQLETTNQIIEEKVVQRTAEVKASEERFRLLMDGVQDYAIIMLDHEGRVVSWNEGAKRVQGYRSAEILGQNFSCFYTDEDMQRGLPAQELAAAQAQGRFEDEGWRVRKDGSRFWANIVFTALRDETGQLQGFSQVTRDITERKQAEDALRQSESRFRRLTSANIIGIIISDLAGNIAEANDNFLNLTGYSRDDLLAGKLRWDEMTPPEYHGVDTRAIEQLRETATTMPWEKECLRKDGSRVPVLVGAALLEHSTDQYIAFILDLTELKQVEEALQKAHDEMEMRVTQRTAELAQANEELHLQKTILEAQGEASIDGILVVSEEGNIVSFNRRFIEMWDIPPEIVASRSDELSLQSVLSKLQDADTFLAKVAYLYEHKDEESQDEIMLKDGRTFDRYSAPVKGAEGMGYGRIWFFHDITERKQAEAAIHQAKEEAERANRAKSEFLSRMSHELRTPLNAVLGFAQIMEMRDLDPKEREAVEHILKAGRHLLDLINEVLDITRIETGRLSLSPEPISITHVAEEVLSLVRPLATPQGIHLINEMSESGSEQSGKNVLADQQRLKQVLLNLLSNAVKYNRPDGTVTLGCEVVSPTTLRIKVSDTGLGLRPQEIEKLFVPFERLGAARSQVEGTGIGLALSKGLVEAMGGQIGVESTVGQGSTFWVELPMVESPLERQKWLRGEDLLPAPPTLTEASARWTVLYIEDNLSNLRLMEYVLSERPEIKLLSAMQGRVGLDLACQHRPDLILLDLHLPDILGDEVLRRLQVTPETKNIPVVMVSADATHHEIARLLDAGAKDYLTKPLDVRRCLQIMEETLWDSKLN